MLGYVIKACLHTHKGAQRDGAEGHITPCQAPPRPITGAVSPPKAHLHTPVEQKGTRAGGEPKLRIPKE